MTEPACRNCRFWKRRYDAAFARHWNDPARRVLGIPRLYEGLCRRFPQYVERDPEDGCGEHEQR